MPKLFAAHPAEKYIQNIPAFSCHIAMEVKASWLQSIQITDVTGGQSGLEGRGGMQGYDAPRHQPDRRPELLSSVAVATMPQHYQMSEKEGKTKAAWDVQPVP